jgi:hypothetical protein
MKTVGILLSLALGCMFVSDGLAQEDAGQDMKIRQVEGNMLERLPPADSGKGGINPSPEMQKLVEMAAKDLAVSQGIDPSEIEVLQASPVTWPDSSMGCPQPDRGYMQVLTDGSRIVLRANGRVYNYHSGGNRQPFHCKKPPKAGPRSNSI